MHFIFKKFKKDQQKRFYRVFLLTDGQVDEPQKVIDLIREKVNARQKENVDLRVFTFGIGNDCDKKLVKESAEVGRGINYLVEDSRNMELLKTKIIDALLKAMEPALDNSILTLTGLADNKKHVVKLGTIYRS